MFGKIKVNIVFIIISFFIVFNTGIQNANAGGFWFESIAAEVMHEAWYEMREVIKGGLLSNLKNTAIQEFSSMMNAQAKNNLITDYNDELSVKVNKDMEKYTNNYFSTIRGQEKGNSDGYIQKASLMSEKAIKKDFSTNNETSNIEDMVGGNVKENLFKENIDGTKSGGVDMLPAALENKNNAYAGHLKAASHISNTREVAVEARKTEAVSGGGFRTEGDTAGSTFEQMAAKEKTFKQDLIANAQTLPELAGIMGTDITSELADVQSQLFDFQENFTKQFEKQAKKKVKGAVKGLFNGKSLLKGGFTPVPIGFNSN